MSDTTSTTTTSTVDKDSSTVADTTDTGASTSTSTSDTGTTGTNTTVTPTVTIDLRPPALSVKHELLRLGLVYSNDWQGGEVWVSSDRSRNLTASIPDKRNSTSVNLTDSVTGNTRTLTINELREVKTILTVSDDEKTLVTEGE